MYEDCLFFKLPVDYKKRDKKKQSKFYIINHHEDSDISIIDGSVFTVADLFI